MSLYGAYSLRLAEEKLQTLMRVTGVGRDAAMEWLEDLFSASEGLTGLENDKGITFHPGTGRVLAE